MGILLRLLIDFSTETVQARREYNKIFKAIKGKNLEPRILYAVRLSFRLMEK